ncbi:hypothetical protein CDEST_12115 [Colletotrichum destructivum]|uniref:Uncharacterized protein n=1 Tax=Colletotrichum destructivum TaxID=34406 RepID=A0AAX4IV70_9PEZI|nr:hypothetical protein CDEST_12115 [Colletotrichum destructivum]
MPTDLRSSNSRFCFTYSCCFKLPVTRVGCHRDLLLAPFSWEEFIFHHPPFRLVRTRHRLWRRTSLLSPQLVAAATSQITTSACHCTNQQTSCPTSYRCCRCLVKETRPRNSCFGITRSSFIGLVRCGHRQHRFFQAIPGLVSRPRAPTGNLAPSSIHLCPSIDFAAPLGTGLE